MNRFTFVLAISVAMLLVCAPAFAADLPNPTCLECHDAASGGPAFSTVEFDVGAVDYDTCESCHWIGMNDVIWGSWQHRHMSANGSPCYDCHELIGGDYPEQAYYYSPDHPTPFGYFDNADSLSATAAELHAIHAGGSWPAAQDEHSPNYCASCHAPASCGACHDDDVAHGGHTLDAAGGTPYPAVTYEQAVGVSVGDANQLTVIAESSLCVNDACHPTWAASEPAFVPACASCHPEWGSGHSGLHDASGTMTSGCIRCHGTHLDSIHEDAGGCGVCHTPDAELGPDQLACESCHGETQHFGRRGR